MKTLKFLLTAFLCCAMVYGLQAQEQYEIVNDAGHLLLKGTSNTSEWELKTQNMTGDAKLVVKDGEVTNIAGVIVDIDGKTIENPLNKRMTKKAQKTLLVNQHPIVTFFAYGYGQTADGPKKIQGTISMAGKTNQLLFDFSTRIQDDIVWIVAVADAKFTDFGLEPPTDFGGAITCKDEIKIEVQLPFTLAQPGMD